MLTKTLRTLALSPVILLSASTWLAVQAGKWFRKLLIDCFAVLLPIIGSYLIKRAKKTPYFHLDGYMNRWWLVPYSYVNQEQGCGPVKLLDRPVAWLLQKFGVAIRIHHILRSDDDRHMHNHPWNARTFILRGWYIEKRREDNGDDSLSFMSMGRIEKLTPADFHTVLDVSEGGVYTMFVTFDYQWSWGFLVNGETFPWRDYLAAKQKEDEKPGLARESEAKDTGGWRNPRAQEQVQHHSV